MNRVVMLHRGQLSQKIGNQLQSGALVLRKYRTYCDIGGVSLNVKQSILSEVWYGQYRGIHQSGFQSIK